MECEYEIVESVALREPIFPERVVFLPQVDPPSLCPDEQDAWLRDTWWMVDYSVHFSLRDRARVLALKLEKQLEIDRNSLEVQATLVELKSMRAKETCEMTPQEKWARTAQCMPDDIGGGSANKAMIADFLSARYKGKVLEAMCGFNSYLHPSPDTVVVALDYCKEALERYPFPERMRIQCDLNQLNGKNSLGCFGSGEFDAISVCFGFRYPKDPLFVLREFKRILKPRGVMVFVENPGSGYANLCKRPFDPEMCTLFLERAGFSIISSEKIISSLETRPRLDYWHVSAYA